MSENWKFIPHREVNASLALGLKIVFAALLFFFGAANANASTINRPPNYISLKSGLVGYWTFDGKDLNTGAALDASGQGNHGALVNMSTSTSRVPGKLGQALKFDGVDDYVLTPAGTVSSLSFIQNTKIFTVSLWTKVGTGNYASFLGNSCSSLGKGYLFSPGNTTEMRTFMGTGGNFSRAYTSSAPITDNKWHHLTFIGNGTTASFQIYMDGMAKAMTVVNDGDLSSGDSTRAMMIGRNQISGCELGTTYPSNLIDDVRIYNRALSAAEITALYRMGQAKISVTPAARGNLASGLVGYWTFDGKDLNTGAAMDAS